MFAVQLNFRWTTHSLVRAEMSDETPFPEHWLAIRQTAHQSSETAKAIQDSMSNEGLNESDLLSRLKRLTLSPEPGNTP